MFLRTNRDLEKLGGKRFNTGQMLMVLSVIILIITVAMPMFMIVWNTFFMNLRLIIKYLMR